MTITRCGIGGFQIVLRPTIRPSSSIRRSASRGHGRDPVDDDAAQVEVGVVPVPHAVDGVGDAADAAQPERRRVDDDQGVAGDGQRRQRRSAQRGRAVEQDGVVAVLGDGGQRRAQAGVPSPRGAATVAGAAGQQVDRVVPA